MSREKKDKSREGGERETGRQTDTGGQTQTQIWVEIMRRETVDKHILFGRAGGRLI